MAKAGKKRPSMHLLNAHSRVRQTPSSACRGAWWRNGPDRAEYTKLVPLLYGLLKVTENWEQFYLIILGQLIFEVLYLAFFCQ